MADKTDFYVKIFSTHVEMNRGKRRRFYVGGYFLHARGDEPFDVSG